MSQDVPYGVPPAYVLGGYASDRRACRACGKLLAKVDDVEGLPVWACPDRHVLRGPAPGASATRGEGKTP